MRRQIDSADRIRVADAVMYDGTHPDADDRLAKNGVNGGATEGQVRTRPREWGDY